eukprot:5956380-Amphidinium_carterae.1
MLGIGQQSILGIIAFSSDGSRGAHAILDVLVGLEPMYMAPSATEAAAVADARPTSIQDRKFVCLLAGWFCYSFESLFLSNSLFQVHQSGKAAQHQQTQRPHYGVHAHDTHATRAQ